MAEATTIMKPTASIEKKSLLGPLIQLDHITKSYSNQTILSDLCIEIEQGEFLAIVGESGSGKSTLLKLIAGLERPQSGRILIGNQCQANTAPHLRDVAVVFQSSNGYDHLTVRENLFMAIRKTDSSKTSVMHEWIDRLDLQSTLSQKLGELSGGQSQRVAIARAMLSDKSVVLLDEPLAHLNQSMRKELRSLLKESHRETGKTFLYVTHDSEEAMQLATRVAVLANGNFQQTGTAREVYENPACLSVSQLFGHQAMSVVRLPSDLVVGDQEEAGEAKPTEAKPPGERNNLVLCGIRPHSWSIRTIRRLASSTDVQSIAKLQPTPDGLLLRGQIADCSWLGGFWQITVAMPSAGETNSKRDGGAIEITSPNSPGNPFRELLQQVCNPGAGEQSDWEIESIIPFSDVQILSK